MNRINMNNEIQYYFVSVSDDGIMIHNFTNCEMMFALNAGDPQCISVKGEIGRPKFFNRKINDVDEASIAALFDDEGVVL